MQKNSKFMAGLALSLLFGASAAIAQDIKIAHVYDKTGVLEAYAKQTQAGLLMGLEYATNGTMMVNGHKIVLIEKDTQGKPDVAKSQLASAYADDKVALAIGPTSSGAALAMLPLETCQQYYPDVPGWTSSNNSMLCAGGCTRYQSRFVQSTCTRCVECMPLRQLSSVH